VIRITIAPRVPNHDHFLRCGESTYFST
jgi:hypothetical protein